MYQQSGYFNVYYDVLLGYSLGGWMLLSEINWDLSYSFTLTSTVIYECTYNMFNEKTCYYRCIYIYIYFNKCVLVLKKYLLLKKCQVDLTCRTHYYIIHIYECVFEYVYLWISSYYRKATYYHKISSWCHMRIYKQDMAYMQKAELKRNFLRDSMNIV